MTNRKQDKDRVKVIERVSAAFAAVLLRRSDGFDDHDLAAELGVPASMLEEPVYREAIAIARMEHED